MAGPTTVDAYLADLPADRRAGIETLRRTVVAAAPDATETISYQMPRSTPTTGGSWSRTRRSSSTTACSRPAAR